jgi:hypothetical protein
MVNEQARRREPFLAATAAEDGIGNGDDGDGDSNAFKEAEEQTEKKNTKRLCKGDRVDLQ